MMVKSAQPGEGELDTNNKIITLYTAQTIKLENLTLHHIIFKFARSKRLIFRIDTNLACMLERFLKVLSGKCEKIPKSAKEESNILQKHSL
jgi:hypothetical protein